MTQIDTDKPPVGATHYGPAVEHLVANWFQFDGSYYYIWLGGNWDRMSSGIQSLRKETLIALPALPAWNGSGLPPVGALVEDRSVLGAPVYIAEVVAVEDGLVAIKRPGSLKVVDIHGIRPIRTPEQIAAEEREKAIKAMCELGVDAGDSTIELTCAALYDAGLRFEVKP